MLCLYFYVTLLILLVNVFIVNAMYIKYFVNILWMKLNGTELPYCADVPLIIYSLTHSCMLETRDIHMYTSDVYASAYVMY